MPCFYFNPKYSIYSHRIFLQLTAAQNFIFSTSLYALSVLLQIKKLMIRF